MAKEKDRTGGLSQLPLHNGYKQEQPSLPTHAQKATNRLLRLKDAFLVSILILSIHSFASVFLAFPLSGLLRLLGPTYVPPFIPYTWDWLIASPTGSSSSITHVGSIIHWALQLPLSFLFIKRQTFKDTNLQDLSMGLTFCLSLGMDLFWLGYWRVRFAGWKRGIWRLGIWGDDNTIEEEKDRFIMWLEGVKRKIKRESPPTPTLTPTTTPGSASQVSLSPGSEG